MEKRDSDFKLYLFYCCFQEQKDLKMKADTVLRLIQRGYRVKVFSLFVPRSLCIYY